MECEEKPNQACFHDVNFHNEFCEMLKLEHFVTLISCDEIIMMAATQYSIFNHDSISNMCIIYAKLR